MKTLTQQITAWGIVGALAVAGAAGVSGCDRNDANASAMQHHAAPVSVVAAVQRDVPVYLDQIGRTRAVETVAIVPQVTGKVLATHVEDGAYLKKGDLLFEIDPRPYQALLAAAEAQLAQSRAERDLANIEFNRTRDLVASSAVSQIEYDQRKSDLAVADAKVLAAEAAVEQAQLDLEYTKITSPIDGCAGARLVDRGNIVKENEGQLLVIQRLDPIYAEFTVTENDLGTVRKFLAAHGLDMSLAERNLSVWVDVPGDSKQVLTALAGIEGTSSAATQPAVSTTSKARGAGPREGKLTFLDNSVQSQTGTVWLRATLPNEDRYFWPGQFVNVRVVLTTKKDAVLIPVKAQQVGQQGPYVYVVKHTEIEDAQTKQMRPATVAEMRVITPGQRQGDLLVIDEGIELGDEVVTVGHMMIQPGAEVTVLPAAPSGADLNTASR